MKAFLFPAVAFLVAFLLALVFVVPQYQDLMLARDLLAQKRSERQTRDSYVERLREIHEDLQEVRQELETVRYAIPSVPNIPSLYVEIQQMASSSGLLLRSVAQGPNEADEGARTGEGEAEQILRSRVRAIPVSLGLSGSYESLKEFLRAVESSPRLMELRSVGFGSSFDRETGARENRFQFSVDLTAFSY